MGHCYGKSFPRLCSVLSRHLDSEGRSGLPTLPQNPTPTEGSQLLLPHFYTLLALLLVHTLHGEYRLPHFPTSQSNAGVARALSVSMSLSHSLFLSLSLSLSPSLSLSLSVPAELTSFQLPRTLSRNACCGRCTTVCVYRHIFQIYIIFHIYMHMYIHICRDKR